MKKIFTFATPAIITLVFTFNVFAQQDGGQEKGSIDPQEMARRQTISLEEVVGLTPDQIRKIDSVNLVYVTELQTIRVAVTEDRSNGRGELISMNNRKDNAIKTILTSEQWVELVQWRNSERKN